MDQTSALTRRTTLALTAGAALANSLPKGARAAPARGGHLVY